MTAGLLGAALIGKVLLGSMRNLSCPFGYFRGLLFASLSGFVLYIFDSKYLILYALFL